VHGLVDELIKRFKKPGKFHHFWIITDAAAAGGLVWPPKPKRKAESTFPEKASSLGSREQGRYAAEFFTVVKTAYTAP
jgi:hypothetical protein